MPKVAGRSDDVAIRRFSLYRVSGQVTSPCKEGKVRNVTLRSSHCVVHSTQATC
jgi:hypothetical protein